MGAGASSRNGSHHLMAQNLGGCGCLGDHCYGLTWAGAMDGFTESLKHCGMISSLRHDNLYMLLLFSINAAW
eukprot:c35864_g1_i1 orf=325-540(+)